MSWSLENSGKYNKLKKTKINDVRQLIYNGVTAKDPLKISKAFNEYFCSIGPKLANSFEENSSSDFTKYMGPACDQSMPIPQTSSTEIFKLINNLVNKKSAGFDNFSAKFLKLCNSHISEPLSTIFNNSIIAGKYPDILKIARVSPIYKNKGPKNDPSNYRPISVLGIIDKVFEKSCIKDFMIT